MSTPVKRNLLPVKTTTPRIDISRASSSSYQEDSSPENELCSEKGPNSKLEVIFGEDMASELHSSTEELSFHDDTPLHGDTRPKKKKSLQTASFSDIGVHNECQFRKDSTCSNDITFLCIGSGRTSRVSSVGSVASGGSGISNLSVATSHLSAASNLSRGSSPHRTSVETSFCGPKPVLTQGVSLEDDASTTIVLNKICQKLTTVLADESKNEKTTDKIIETNEVINTQKSKGLPKKSKGSNIGTKSPRTKPKIVNPKTQLFVSLYSDEEDEPVDSCCTAPVANITPVKPPLPTVTLESTQIFIPLKGDPKEELQSRHPAVKFSSDSPKKLEPYTNPTLVNFISKYDVNSDRGVGVAVAKMEDETYTQTKINKEFQTFISLKDDDDSTPTSSEVKSNNIIKEANDAGIGSTITATTTVIVPAQYGSNREAGVTNSSASQKPILMDRTTTVTSGCAGTQFEPSQLIEDYNQGKPNYIKTDLNNRQSGTDCISTKQYETKFESHDCTNLELNFSECPTRLAKSMTQLVSSNCNNKMEYYFPKAPVLNGCDDGCNGRYLKVENNRFRRCSESEKEMAVNDRPKSRSRSGSIQSLLTSIFKKNNKTNDRKKSAQVNNGHEDCQVHCNKWATETNGRMVTESSNKAADKIANFVIIPLHSPDDAPSKDLLPREQLHCTDNFTRVEAFATKTIEDSATTPPKVHQSPQPREVHEKTRRKCSFQLDDKVANEYGTEEIKDTIEFSSQDVNENDDVIVKDDRNCELNEETAISKVQDQNVDERAHYKPQKGDETDESSDSDRNVLIHSTSTENEENKKLVNQEESFEELPYVPTTLPLERSAAVPIISVRERTSEIRTQSIDRPRLSIPSHRGSFDFCAMPTITTARENSDLDAPLSSNEKLHIILPRTSSLKNSKLKRVTTEKMTDIDLSSTVEIGKRVEESVQDNGHQPNDESSSRSPITETNDLRARKLPKKLPTWIGFDDTNDEYRQSPKRITTLPSSYATDAAAVATTVDMMKICNDSVVFVQPNECSCECHEVLTHNTDT